MLNLYQFSYGRIVLQSVAALIALFPVLLFAQTPLNIDVWMTRVDVDIHQQWTDTGRDLVAGDSVLILAFGYASGAAGSAQTVWSGPEGTWFSHSPAFPCPNAPFNSVVGRIGVSGTPFYVGRALAFSANTDGRLYLGYNDDIMEGNDGKYIALITEQTHSDTIPDAVFGNAPSPRNFELGQNFPNPFNPTTTINFSIQNAGRYTLEVFNINGQLIRTLFDEVKALGNYATVWDARNESGQAVSSGEYFYSLRSPTGVVTKAMLHVK